MPTGVTALEKTLIGVEASAGGSTDIPTTHWRGMGKLKDTAETIFPPERVGRIGGTTRSYIAAKGGEATLEADAKFEQLPYIFNAGIYTATPTTDTGSGFIWTWNVQSASTDALATTDINTLVIETGDNYAMRRARYGYVKEFTISGKQGEAIQISATLGTRDPSTDTAFTAVGSTDLENPAEAILVSMMALSIDASTDALGTTAKTETLLEFSVKHTTGWVPLEAKDGRLDFSSIKHIDDEIMIDVTFEHNSVADAEYSAWKAGTERAVRLEFTGTALSVAGVHATKKFRIDSIGKWVKFAADGLEEQNGDNIYKGTLRVAYSPIAVNKMTYLIVNEVQTLP